MRWIETKTDEQAAKVYFDAWDTRFTTTDTGWEGSSQGILIDGEFWTVALEAAKHDPVKRIAAASKALPIPAAWREVAVGHRALIRAARKGGSDYDTDLKALHKLAAIHSFALDEQSGYDFLALIPFSRLASLAIDFDDIGCNVLPLLNQTDRKWMMERWGEPSRHTTAQERNKEAFEREITRIKAVHDRHEKASQRALDRLLANIDEEPARATAPRSPQPTPEPKRGFLAGLLRGFTR